MSVVKGKLVKMEVIQVGEYEFTKQDIIGHGAFAMVYKGRKRKVRTYDLQFHCSSSTWFFRNTVALKALKYLADEMIVLACSALLISSHRGWRR